MDQSSDRPPQLTSTNTSHTPHAVIAGTGRAGTTFLMEWLRTAGVPGPDLRHLPYNDDARAGFETALLDAGASYLVKDPWLSDYLHQLGDATFSIDALIVPVRRIDAVIHRFRSRVRRGADPR